MDSKPRFAMSTLNPDEDREDQRPLLEARFVSDFETVRCQRDLAIWAAAIGWVTVAILMLIHITKL